ALPNSPRHSASHAAYVGPCAGPDMTFNVQSGRACSCPSTWSWSRSSESVVTMPGLPGHDPGITGHDRPEYPVLHENGGLLQLGTQRVAIIRIAMKRPSP